MKRLSVLFVLTALLAIPAAAEAKGPIVSMGVCGVGGCGGVRLDKMPGGPPSMDLFYGDEGVSIPDPTPGPYYELRLDIGSGMEPWFVLPGFDVAGGGDTWRTLPPALAGLIREAAAARPLQPYRFELSSVTVDRVRVGDPATYLGLFSLPPGRILASEAYKHSSQWVTIDASTTRTTPWGALRAYYDPVLHAASVNGHQWAPVPAAIADRIDSAAGIAKPAASSGGGTDTAPWALGGAVALAAVGVLGLLRRRRRPRPGPAPVA